MILKARNENQNQLCALSKVLVKFQQEHTFRFLKKSQL